MGRPHPELECRLADDPALGTGRVGSVFVPGAGTGNDAEALARVGWQVTAVDFAEAVVPALRDRLGPFGGSVTAGDALTMESGDRFDVVFDHTFFCAIDPARRPEFGAMCRRVLEPGGSVMSIVFPIDRPEADGGPPWRVDVESVSDALGRRFELVDESHPFRVPGRRHPHRWARWVLDG